MSTADVPDPTRPLSPDDFQNLTGLPDERMEVLRRYGALLGKWQKAINLVGKSTLPDLWRRHMLDSYQLLNHTEKQGGTWLDLGSGAGFPALVVAACSGFEVHAVESDQRKCLFMQNVSRETMVSITVHNCRIEALPPMTAGVISARALAPLEKLLELATPHGDEETEYLFLKGQDVDEELTNATKWWNMKVEKHRSVTSEDGALLKLTRVRRLS